MILYLAIIAASLAECECANSRQVWTKDTSRASGCIGVCVSKSPVSQTGRGLVVLRRGGEVGRLTQKNYMRAFPMNDIDFLSLRVIFQLKKLD